MNCPHLINSQCGIASSIAQLPVIPDPVDCYACCRYDNKHNEITKALARAYDPTLLPEDEGVGTGLAKIFSFFISKPANCPCGDRAEIMNMWGPARCLENIPTILGWLRESALDNGYPYNEFIISSLLKSYLRLYIKV
jgi:hypothetical protein